ncbi:MAG: penicillin-binding protein 1C [Bacteroidia bacterium]
MKSYIKSNKKKSLAFGVILLLCLAFFIKKDRYFSDLPYATAVLSSNQQLLSAQIATDGQWRFPPVDSVPKKFTHCLTLFEDEYFYSHPGINPVSLARAIIQNIKAKRVVSGGSTISMQVVRMGRNATDRSILQKIKEIFWALRLELHYSKDEILNQYVHHAPFGGNVVGLQAAAWRYYNRDAHFLSWAEYAALAVLPNAPALIHPGRNSEDLLAKRNKLLKKLFKKKIIDETDYELALLEEIPSKPLALPQNATHLLQSHINKFEGLTTITTIDANLQKRSQEILDRYIAIYQGNAIYNGAILVADIESGNVLSYIGNSSIKTLSNKGLWNDMVKTERSTGSVLKPFLYAAMLNEGQILPNSLVEDVPTFISGYAPKNYNKDFNGAVKASMALARSLNVPAVRMLRDYSFPKFHSKLQKLGMNTLHKPAGHYGLSIILGGAEGTLWNLCSMYASMGRSLIQFQDHSLEYRSDNYRPLSIVSYASSSTNRRKVSREQLKDHSELSAASIWYTFKAMEEVHRPESQIGWKNFSSSKKVAWKTGTSFGYRDAWAIGVDGKYVVGVWIGNANGIGRDDLVGVKKAAPVMFDIFNMLPNNEWFTPPYDDFKHMVVCKESGHAATEICPKSDTIDVPNVEMQIAPCPYHKIVHLDKTETHQVNSNCEPVLNMTNKPWFILPPVQEYYYSKKNNWYKSLPPLRSDCLSLTESESVFSFIYPEDFSKVKIPKELDGSSGELVIRITHRKQETRVFWYIDNAFVAETKSFHELGIYLKPGEHEITVVDENGNSLSQQLIILQ